MAREGSRPTKAEAAVARKERLARALKDNLKRRKAQSRAREGVVDTKINDTGNESGAGR